VAVPEELTTRSQFPPLEVDATAVNGSDPPAELDTATCCNAGEPCTPKENVSPVSVTVSFGGLAEPTLKLTDTLREAGAALGTLMASV
jgi:hypothetical protein